ncbi:MAG: RnfABCDGE type electron transport complex subunit D [Kiritimatiellae bacterium]|nr:RnfABCDGE type electron transport complex subunit D [Kiritimatiellia bacterium]MDW8457878.1 RnfABCDGE type electron transport complex subunit D [Verrucomicrobiota bacterium]
MSELGTNVPVGTAPPNLVVAPGPHLHSGSLTTQRMMFDVIGAILPVAVVEIAMSGHASFYKLLFAAACCMGAEWLFQRMRGRRATLRDGSALLTGLILGLSFPPNTPWHIVFSASLVAIGLGKMAYGGLGQNIFNPAMVGRAFAIVAFPSALGASAYVPSVDGVSLATPLSAFKAEGFIAPLVSLFAGVGENAYGTSSALASLVGGVYLCLRRSASWEIPAAMLGAAALGAGVIQALGVSGGWTVLHELSGGALVFGAFFIATDPVTSPLTPLGKAIFGAGIGLLVIVIRKLTGYPEGVMFAVLVMNAFTPLINRWTVPTPLGGPMPERKSS